VSTDVSAKNRHTGGSFHFDAGLIQAKDFLVYYPCGNFQFSISDFQTISNYRMNYDLEERTMLFSKEVIRCLLKMKTNDINRNIILQLIRSATSVGANYLEANGASSKKDFKNKISICRKEIQETKYWIELLAEASPDGKDSLKRLWKESHELTLIFNKIATSLRKEN
jgi:four helix bundle protein